MITEKCYDHLWSAVIADSTDPLFQVSLALQTPWATDLQSELTQVFVYPVSMLFYIPTAHPAPPYRID